MSHWDINGFPQKRNHPIWSDRLDRYIVNIYKYIYKKTRNNLYINKRVNLLKISLVHVLLFIKIGYCWTLCFMLNILQQHKLYI